MIAKKGTPALRRWANAADHVFCDRGLADIDAEFQKFAVDSRRAPERILPAHASDKASDLRFNGRTSRPTTPTFSQQIVSKALLAPSLYGVCVHDLQRFRPAGPDR